jgi:hypothetical protein
MSQTRGQLVTSFVGVQPPFRKQSHVGPCTGQQYPPPLAGVSPLAVSSALSLLQATTDSEPSTASAATTKRS